MSTPFTAAFTKDFEAAINDAERLLRTFDDEAAQRLAAAKTPPSTAHPVVAVVGEAKRGKSSLVNVLLRQFDLSPVGVTETTAAPVAFRYGSTPTAHVYLTGEQEPVVADHDELEAWVTVAGAERSHRAPTRWVDVQLPLPPLKTFTLVDTPGLGGLASSIGQLTLEAISRATVLVFVAECHSELTSVELDFLAAAADRVDTVLLVLTSSGDLPPHDLALIMSANQTRLRAVVPRLADTPILGVDSTTAEHALRTSDPEQAGTRWERSGFATLERTLNEVTAHRGWSLLYLNTLRLAAAALTQADKRLAERAAAIDDPQHLAALQQGRDRLQYSRRTLGRQTKTQLSVALNNARIEIGRDIGRLMLQLEEAHAAAIKSGRADLRSLPEHIAADLDGVCLELAEHLARIADRLTNDRLADIFSDDDLAAATEQLGQRILLVDGTSRVLPPGDRDLPLTVASSAGLAFMTGKATFMAGAALPAAFAAPVILPIVAVGLGVTAAAALTRLRATRMRRTDALSWLARSVPDVKNELNALAVARLNEVQASLTLALDDVLDERLVQLDVQIRQIEADRKSAASAPAAIRQSRAQLSTALTRLERLSEQLRATPSMHGSPPALHSSPL